MLDSILHKTKIAQNKTQSKSHQQNSGTTSPINKSKKVITEIVAPACNVLLFFRLVIFKFK